MNRSDTTCAVGTPKNVQLSWRRVSSANRTTPYQMKKTRTRSPGRSRSRSRKPSQMRTTAPSNAGQRLVQEERVEAGRLRERRRTEYAAIRCTHSIGIPQGSVVGGPYSSWLKKLPQRATACIANSAGRDDVRPAPERQALHPRVDEDRDEPGRDPAVHAEAGVRRQDDLEQVVLVERPLVDDVVEPAADQRRDRDDDHPVADDLGVLAGPPGQANQDLVGHGQPDRVADPVPVHGERPELERDRVRDEVEHPPKCSGRRSLYSAP